MWAPRYILAILAQTIISLQFCVLEMLLITLGLSFASIKNIHQKYDHTFTFQMNLLKIRNSTQSARLY